MASVDLPRPIYSALNGEEIKRMVLKDISVYLDNDTRFKRSVAYHLPEYTIRVDLSSQGQPTEEVILRGTPPIRTLEAEKLHLEDVIEALKQKHQEALDYEKGKHARLVEKLDAQIEKLQQQVSEARAVAEKLDEKLKSRRSAESKQSVGEDGSTQFSITIQQPPIEEPDRARDALEKSENQQVGRSPEEVANLDSQGQPAPPPAPANRGAVVGGGQRPANVVGKPK
jgi:predicted RNase H-like nuclease (RuvC/YqgF family)